MITLFALWGCTTEAPAPAPAPAEPAVVAVPAPAPPPGIPSDWERIDKPKGAVPLAERPPPQGPTGAALADHVKGKTYRSGTSTFVFDDTGKVQMTWMRMKGEPVAGKVEIQGDNLVVNLEEAKNTLNRRLVFEGTETCRMTLVHRTQRGVGESVVDVPAEQIDPPCTP